jgi:hypothetical protein
MIELLREVMEVTNLIGSEDFEAMTSIGIEDFEVTYYIGNHFQNH